MLMMQKCRVMPDKSQGDPRQGRSFPWGFDSAMALSRIPSVGFFLPSLASAKYLAVFFIQGILSAPFTGFMPRRTLGSEVLINGETNLQYNVGDFYMSLSSGGGADKAEALLFALHKPICLSFLSIFPHISFFGGHVRAEAGHTMGYRTVFKHDLENVETHGSLRRSRERDKCLESSVIDSLRPLGGGSESAISLAVSGTPRAVTLYEVPAWGKENKKQCAAIVMKLAFNHGQVISGPPGPH